MVYGLSDNQTEIDSDSIPWHAPDIFLEASAPDKLPSLHFLCFYQVDKKIDSVYNNQWWYLTYVIVLHFLQNKKTHLCLKKIIIIDNISLE